jgi:hypothetical protein
LFSFPRCFREQQTTIIYTAASDFSPLWLVVVYSFVAVTFSNIFFLFASAAGSGPFVWLLAVSSDADADVA